MDDNNLDNKWTLRDLPLIALENIKEWLGDRGFDNATAKETICIMLLACGVWAVIAAIFYVATFGVWGD